MLDVEEEEEEEKRSEAGGEGALIYFQKLGSHQAISKPITSISAIESGFALLGYTLRMSLTAIKCCLLQDILYPWWLSGANRALSWTAFHFLKVKNAGIIHYKLYLAVYSFVIVI